MKAFDFMRPENSTLNGSPAARVLELWRRLDFDEATIDRGRIIVAELENRQARHVVACIHPQAVPARVPLKDLVADTYGWIWLRVQTAAPISKTQTTNTTHHEAKP